jgi:hypothetical protein
MEIYLSKRIILSGLLAFPAHVLVAREEVGRKTRAGCGSGSNAPSGQ